MLCFILARSQLQMGTCSQLAYLVKRNVGGKKSYQIDGLEISVVHLTATVEVSNNSQHSSTNSVHSGLTIVNRTVYYHMNGNSQNILCLSLAGSVSGTLFTALETIPTCLYFCSASSRQNIVPLCLCMVGLFVYVLVHAQ